MDRIPGEILSFIGRHHVLTLATSAGENVWCAQVFYVFNPEQASFYFTSSNETLHVRQMCHNCFVAGGIVLETKTVGLVQGLQLQGVATKLKEEEKKEPLALYTKRFPVAKLMETHLWRLDVTLLKYTDNKLIFGKKLLWHRNAGTQVLTQISLEGQKDMLREDKSNGEVA